MKKVILFFALAITCVGFSQVKTPINFAQNFSFLQNLNSDVQKVHIKFNKASDPGEYQELLYKDNKLVARTTYFTNGKQSNTIVTYDKNNNIINVTNDGSVNTFKYDKQGNLIEYANKSSYGKNSNLYTYKDNKLHIETVKGKGGKTINTDTYNYDSSGKLTHIDRKEFTGSNDATIKRIYHSQNQYTDYDPLLTKHITTNDQGVIIKEVNESTRSGSINQYVFNDQGLLIQTTGPSGIVGDYEYLRDDKGNVIRYSLKNSNGLDEFIWDIEYTYN